MAHGSKKWIVDATGRYKKSRDRTKKDYYARVKHWNEYVNPKFYRGKYYNAAEFCPQCKGIQKEYDAEKAERQTQIDNLRKEYHKKFGDAITEWEVYDNGYSLNDQGYYSTYIPFEFRIKPKSVRPPKMWDWQSTEYPASWHYHWRNNLCYKHEHWQEKQDEQWRMHVNGEKSHYRTWVKLSRMYYRAEVKNIMQRAKYIVDYEGYDEILPRKREWLD